MNSPTPSVGFHGGISRRAVTDAIRRRVLPHVGIREQAERADLTRAVARRAVGEHERSNIPVERDGARRRLRLGSRGYARDGMISPSTVAQVSSSGAVRMV